MNQVILSVTYDFIQYLLIFSEVILSRFPFTTIYFEGVKYLELSLNIINSEELGRIFSFVFFGVWSCRNWFGDIVNLLWNIELLIHDKPLAFMVGIINLYCIILYQVYLLPCITTHIFIFLSLVLWNSGDVVVRLCINSTSLSGYAPLCFVWISGALLELVGIIWIIFWGNMCEISIRK